MKNTPFVKGQLIRFSGEVANAPRGGSGIVKLQDELIVPLANLDEFIRWQTIFFWPVLLNDGTIKHIYTYALPTGMGVEGDRTYQPEEWARYIESKFTIE